MTFSLFWTRLLKSTKYTIKKNRNIGHGSTEVVLEVSRSMKSPIIKITTMIEKPIEKKYLVMINFLYFSLQIMKEKAPIIVEEYPNTRKIILIE